MPRLRLFLAALLLGITAAGTAHAACESGLAERMHAKLHPQRELDERLAACKAWPAFPGRSIVVLPLVKAAGEGMRLLDLELLLIQRPDNGNTERDTVVARLFQPEALTEDAVAIQDIRIDTARYTLASDARAFGLRVRYRGSSRANPFASETLRLYLPHGSKLRPVLEELELDRDSGEWDTQCNGRFEQLRTQVSVGRTGSNGLADLLLSRTLKKSHAQMHEDGDCREAGGPARFSTATLHYDGERYKVPKALRAP